MPTDTISAQVFVERIGGELTRTKRGDKGGERIRPYLVDLLQFLFFLMQDFPRLANIKMGQSAFGKVPDLSPESVQYFLSADLRIINSYVEYLQRQNYQNASISRKICSLRVCYQCCLNLGLITVSPASEVALSLKGARTQHAIVNDEEFERLLQVFDATDLIGARNRAILQVLYRAGLQVNEICELTNADIDPQQMVILTSRRGWRRCDIPLPQMVLTAIRDYAMILKIQSSDPSKDLARNNHIFLNENFDAISGRLVSEIVSNALDGAALEGLSIKFTPKSLRHAYAHNLQQAGVSIEKIRQLLGHATVVTTNGFLGQGVLRSAQ